MTWEDSIACPVCHTTEMVYPSGYSKSPILIVGDAPGKEELKLGRPFIGNTGTILRNELGHLGVDYNRMRITNLWLHPDNGNEKCLQYGIEQVIKEAKDRKLILLIGAGTVKQLCNVGVEEYNGLVVPCPYLSATVMVSVQPAIVFQENGMIGEMKFAMKNFAKMIEEMRLL